MIADGLGSDVGGFEGPRNSCEARAGAFFQGVIRAHLLEGEKLAQKDNFLGLRGKSDPYAKVSIGLQHFRSRTIYKNLNPTWNEVFEVRVSLAAPSCSPCPPGLHSGWFCLKQGRALPSRSSHTHGQHWATGVALGNRLAEMGCSGP